MPFPSVGDDPERVVYDEHCVDVPPLAPAQVHNHSPALVPVPDAATDAVPAMQRLAVGADEEAFTVAIPHWPLVLAGVVTVTVQAFEVMLEPSDDLAVICAVPVDTPVTTPEELIVATAVLPDCQLTPWLVALKGSTVAVRGVVEPTTVEAVNGIVIPVTGVEAAAETVTVALAGVDEPPVPVQVSV